MGSPSLRRRGVAWLFLCAVVACAGVRVVLATPLAEAPAATAEQKRAAFAALAAAEPGYRLDAMKEFPADAWSQDDAFHNLEHRRAKQLAAELGIRLMDVLFALDQGMRERWTSVPLESSVVPCRPRPIY